MNQTPSFKDDVHPQYVCKLNKAIYGVKQAARAWFHKLSSRLLTLGFTSSSADSSLFIQIHNNYSMFILVYVTNILITGDSDSDIQQVIAQLHAEFASKDLGNIHHFLGVHVTSTAAGLYLSQSTYVSEVLQKVNMDGAKPINNPSQLSNSSSTLADPFPDVTKYKSIVGALQYVTITHPDIAYAVNKACLAMHAPTLENWQAVKRVLCYLKGSIDQGLLLQPSSTYDLLAYMDSDWVGCPTTRRSTSGFCIYMGKSLISWSSKKQKVVARSSTEAEYRSLALCITELCATFLSVNPVLHSRIKHVEIDVCFVWEKVTSGALRVQYVSTVDQNVDLFTKALSTARFSMLKSKLNVVFPPFNLKGGNRPCITMHDSSS
ncbi:transmembrane signal receptor [Lithospermum erythrorhizon]|uniref:Transmembrane signal receptor n=1 Tax=Lithospermum erythrorhizon TaxID=34254 RepID=A0AAV3R2Y9_LITER